MLFNVLIALEKIGLRLRCCVGRIRLHKRKKGGVSRWFKEKWTQFKGVTVTDEGVAIRAALRHTDALARNNEEVLGSVVYWDEAAWWEPADSSFRHTNPNRQVYWQHKAPDPRVGINSSIGISSIKGAVAVTIGIPDNSNFRNQNLIDSRLQSFANSVGLPVHTRINTYYPDTK